MLSCFAREQYQFMPDLTESKHNMSISFASKPTTCLPQAARPCLAVLAESGIEERCLAVRVPRIHVCAMLNERCDYLCHLRLSLLPRRHLCLHAKIG